MLIGVVILLLVKKNLGAFFKFKDFSVYLQESEIAAIQLPCKVNVYVARQQQTGGELWTHKGDAQGNLARRTG